VKTQREGRVRKREEEEPLEGEVCRSKSLEKRYSLDYLVGAWSPTCRIARKPTNK